MPTAPVAYENSAEAKRKLKSVKPLRWHRERDGLYKAKGERGHYSLFHRAPDRRHGVFPWTVALGGMRGQEIKQGGFDLKGEAQTFAAQFDAGLCGAPPVVVVNPEASGPAPGIYRGTLAGEAQRRPYFEKVEAALKGMGSGGLSSESPDYVSRMEAAGIDPTIVATVLVATHQHGHVHNCHGKHVEMNEAREARRQGTGGDPVGLFRVYYKDEFGVSRMEWIEAGSEDEALAIAQAESEAHGHAMQSEARVVPAAAEEAKKRMPQPDPSTGYYITHSSVTRDLWLMKGDRLIARSGSRDELLRMAQDKIASEAGEARPKGRSRR